MIKTIFMMIHNDLHISVRLTAFELLGRLNPIFMFREKKILKNVLVGGRRPTSFRAVSRDIWTIKRKTRGKE